jgi:hypothetical protein
VQQTDVKAVNVTATGASGAGRCRVKGLYYVSAAGAGSVSIRDGGASGTERIKIDTPAAAVAYYLPFPGEGVLFSADPYVTLTAATSVTFFYA